MVDVLWLFFLCFRKVGRLRKRAAGGLLLLVYSVCIAYAHACDSFTAIRTVPLRGADRRRCPARPAAGSASAIVPLSVFRFRTSSPANHPERCRPRSLAHGPEAFKPVGREVPRVAVKASTVVGCEVLRVVLNTATAVGREVPRVAVKASTAVGREVLRAVLKTAMVVGREVPRIAVKASTAVGCEVLRAVLNTAPVVGREVPRVAVKASRVVGCEVLRVVLNTAVVGREVLRAAVKGATAVGREAPRVAPFCDPAFRSVPF